ncbi:hypothetical protein Taro_018319 [Colocasia esculenta]|uniref:Uncharacterized protein n=1 Tax=Colocasia esculenta TaxID=4460 RepID=A0A843UIF5_COLES|nr:hypothetical protein [Colocasia esculenta]
MKFKFHIPTKLRMSSVMAFTRFTSQEKARTWPWLGNAGISCMRAGFCKSTVWGVFSPGRSRNQSSLTSPLARRVLRCPGTSLRTPGFAPVDCPVDEEAMLLCFSVSQLSGSQQEQGGTEASRSVDVGFRYLKHKLCFKLSKRSCDLERCRNNPQETTELFSFGRSKEEKLKSHHHPQREATAPT